MTLLWASISPYVVNFNIWNAETHKNLIDSALEQGNETFQKEKHHSKWQNINYKNQNMHLPNISDRIMTAQKSQQCQFMSLTSVHSLKKPSVSLFFLRKNPSTICKHHHDRFQQTLDPWPIFGDFGNQQNGHIYFETTPCATTRPCRCHRLSTNQCQGLQKPQPSRPSLGNQGVSMAWNFNSQQEWDPMELGSMVRGLDCK